MLKIFEAAVHNQDVRDAVSRCEHHPFFTDDWANKHLIEVRAHTIYEAMASLTRKFPPAKGFHIEGLKALKEFE